MEAMQTVWSQCCLLISVSCMFNRNSFCIFFVYFKMSISMAYLSVDIDMTATIATVMLVRNNRKVIEQYSIECVPMCQIIRYINCTI